MEEERNRIIELLEEVESEEYLELVYRFVKKLSKKNVPLSE